MEHLCFTDDELVRQFQSCQLDPQLFNHEAHLRIAWIYINKFGLDAAIESMCEDLYNYVDHLSAKDKFNKTLTVAAIRAVDHFNKRSLSLSFVDFIKRYPQLKNDFKRLIASHYKTDIFNSPSAKLHYLEPDLLPFD